MKASVSSRGAAKHALAHLRLGRAPLLGAARPAIARRPGRAPPCRPHARGRRSADALHTQGHGLRRRARRRQHFAARGRGALARAVGARLRRPRRAARRAAARAAPRRRGRRRGHEGGVAARRRGRRRRAGAPLVRVRAARRAAGGRRARAEAPRGDRPRRRDGADRPGAARLPVGQRVRGRRGGEHDGGEGLLRVEGAADQVRRRLRRQPAHGVGHLRVARRLDVHGRGEGRAAPRHRLVQSGRGRAVVRGRVAGGEALGRGDAPLRRRRRLALLGPVGGRPQARARRDGLRVGLGVRWRVGGRREARQGRDELEGEARAVRGRVEGRQAARPRRARVAQAAGRGLALSDARAVRGAIRRAILGAILGAIL